MYLKCDTLIPTYLTSINLFTYLPTHPYTYLHALPPSLHNSLLSRYLPSPTYLVASSYMIVTPIDPTIVENDEK
jgi:hypothetical protein